MKSKPSWGELDHRLSDRRCAKGAAHDNEVVAGVVRVHHTARRLILFGDLGFVHIHLPVLSGRTKFVKVIY